MVSVASIGPLPCSAVFAFVLINAVDQDKRKDDAGVVCRYPFALSKDSAVLSPSLCCRLTAAASAPSRLDSRSEVFRVRTPSEPVGLPASPLALGLKAAPQGLRCRPALVVLARQDEPLFELSSSSELLARRSGRFARPLYGAPRWGNRRSFLPGFLPLQRSQLWQPVSPGPCRGRAHRPQGFSPSRRLPAPIALRPYFMPLTLLGFHPGPASPAHLVKVTQPHVSRGSSSRLSPVPRQPPLTATSLLELAPARPEGLALAAPRGLNHGPVGVCLRRDRRPS